jgi:hypothetical protein
MNLRERLELTGEHLLSCLLPEWHHLPHWSIRVCRDYQASVRRYWPAHNIGRWWDALLRLSAATGFSIPAELEAHMLANTHRFFDNPDHLCLAPRDLEGVEPFFELHSLREGLLALHALVRYRSNRWAAGKGHQMLETIQRAFRDDGTWDLSRFAYLESGGGKTNVLQRHMDPTGSHGRLLEALVWFFQATEDELAFELAQRIAQYHVRHTTRSDGTLNRDSGADHTHSYFGTLRGLLLYGELTNRADIIERVAGTYRVSVRRLVRESGFTSHDLDSDGFGETTSPGDAAQLALWLSRNGYTEFLDDAERIVRARLLPGQITAPPMVDPAPDETIGAERLNSMLVGAIGGCHGRPHSHKGCVTDVSAAGLHSLVDVYNHIVTTTPLGTTVNLHLDYEDKDISVTSHRPPLPLAPQTRGDRGRETTLVIRAQRAGPLAIRVPAWTPAESVKISLNDEPVSGLRIGPYLRVVPAAPGARIALQYALPEKVTQETSMMETYEIHWRGDEVVGISPHDDFFPFYPTAPVKIEL